MCKFKFNSRVLLNHNSVPNSKYYHPSLRLTDCLYLPYPFPVVSHTSSSRNLNYAADPPGSESSNSSVVPRYQNPPLASHCPEMDISPPYTHSLNRTRISLPRCSATLTRSVPICTSSTNLSEFFGREASRKRYPFHPRSFCSDWLTHDATCLRWHPANRPALSSRTWDQRDTGSWGSCRIYPGTRSGEGVDNNFSKKYYSSNLGILNLVRTQL